MHNQKNFGVWMDTRHATIVGKENIEDGPLVIIAHVAGEGTPPNSSEKNAHNEEVALLNKYFKEIAVHLQNATHIHVTGTGQVQEQFMHHLADTAQFKNTVTEDSTSNKMSDEKLLEFMADKIK